MLYLNLTESSRLKRVGLIFLIAVSLLIISSQCKCQNNTEFRYELKQIAQIQGYNALCNQFTRRTCCSSKNVDVLARKISKSIFTGVEQLSLPCRFKLTNMMCSPCDGDVGQAKVSGLCRSYCFQIQEACKKDYFVMDTNGKLRVCKEDDIVCTQLSYIVGSQSACELFGYKIGKQHDCFDGKSSADVKGSAKKKLKYFYKRVIPGQEQNSTFDNQTVQMYAIYGMGLLLIVLVSWKYGKSQMKGGKKYYHRLD